jgi:hypothetical protein
VSPSKKQRDKLVTAGLVALFAAFMAAIGYLTDTAMTCTPPLAWAGIG